MISLLATGLFAVIGHPLRELLQRSVNQRFMDSATSRTASFPVWASAWKLHSHLTPSSLQLSKRSPRRQASLLSHFFEARPGIFHRGILWHRGRDATSCATDVSNRASRRTTPRSASQGRVLYARRPPLAQRPCQAGGKSRPRDTTYSRFTEVRLERLVTAREEERRRLRRDLHDGLGPTLASITLKLDATRNLLTRDLPAADALLIDLEKTDAGGCVRHLPPRV